MRGYLALVILSLVLTISCHKNVTSLKYQSQSSVVNNVQNLNNILTKDAPYGWRVLYFPQTDSLLFSDVNQILETNGFLINRFGYGGFCYIMQFNVDSTVTMWQDYSADSSMKQQRSKFSIKQGSATQISFITHNYIHSLGNGIWNGSSDFIFMGKDYYGNLVFKNPNYINAATDYMVLQKLKNPEDGEKYLSLSISNREAFEKMNNPQLRIRKGARIYYVSDVFYPQKSSSASIVSSGIKYTSNRQLFKENRYFLFRTMKKLGKSIYDQENTINPSESIGLGSGYVGTDSGLFFYPGIRYNDKIIFYDFKRVDEPDNITNLNPRKLYIGFRCELVEVFDDITQSKYLLPRHRVSYGIPTNWVAEIYDDTTTRIYREDYIKKYIIDPKTNK